MKQSTKEGLSFGITSAVITTLGLFIGLSSATGNKIVAISGIITIAVADSLSDALGIHLSQESNKKNKQEHIWQATFSTFITKFIITISFIIPIFFFSLTTAIIISIIYGLTLLAIFSYAIAKSRKENPKKAIFEHLSIAIIVIIITEIVGRIIHSFT